eukprot:403357129
MDSLPNSLSYLHQSNQKQQKSQKSKRSNRNKYRLQNESDSFQQNQTNDSQKPQSKVVVVQVGLPPLVKRQSYILQQQKLQLQLKNKNIQENMKNLDNNIIKQIIIDSSDFFINKEQRSNNLLANISTPTHPSSQPKIKAGFHSHKNSLTSNNKESSFKLRIQKTSQQSITSETDNNSKIRLIQGSMISQYNNSKTKDKYKASLFGKQRKVESDKERKLQSYIENEKIKRQIKILDSSSDSSVDSFVDQSSMSNIKINIHNQNSPAKNSIKPLEGQQNFLSALKQPLTPILKKLQNSNIKQIIRKGESSLTLSDKIGQQNVIKRRKIKKVVNYVQPTKSSLMIKVINDLSKNLSQDQINFRRKLVDNLENSRPELRDIKDFQHKTIKSKDNLKKYQINTNISNMKISPLKRISMKRNNLDQIRDISNKRLTLAIQNSNYHTNSLSQSVESMRFQSKKNTNRINENQLSTNTLKIKEQQISNRKNKSSKEQELVINDDDFRQSTQQAVSLIKHTALGFSKFNFEKVASATSSSRNYSLRESEKIEDPFHFYQTRKENDLEVGYKVVFYARPIKLKTKFKPSTAYKFRQIFSTS